MCAMTASGRVWVHSVSYNKQSFTRLINLHLIAFNALTLGVFNNNGEWERWKIYRYYQHSKDSSSVKIHQV